MSNEQVLYNRPSFPAQLNLNHPLSKGLVGCWVLNEEGGMRAWDSSGYGLHGTVVGGAKGNYQGRTFVAASSQYIIKTVANWQSSDQSGTVLGWFKTGTNGSAVFSSADNGSNASFINCFIQSNFIQIGDGTNQVQGSTTVNDNAWHLGVWQSNGTAWSFFVDGVLQTLTVVSGSNTGNWFADMANRDNVVIGSLQRATPGSYMNGIIGEVLVYNRGLPAQQVTWLYREPYCMFL